MRPAIFIIILSFFVALMLAIMPLPDMLRTWRPDWVVLVLIYWCFAVPERVSVGTGWMVGLLNDVITGNILGQSALGLALVAYISTRLHQRTRVQPILQQTLTVMILLALYRVVTVWIMGISGQDTSGWQYWQPVIPGVLLWPLVYGLLHRFGHAGRVS